MNRRTHTPVLPARTTRPDPRRVRRASGTLVLEAVLRAALVVVLVGQAQPAAAQDATPEALPGPSEDAAQEAVVPAGGGSDRGSVDADVAPVFAIEALKARAARLAEGPARRVDVDLPPSLADLDYDAYRKIDFRPEARLWAGEGRGFTVDLMHLGALYRIPVQIHALDEEGLRDVSFDSAAFEYRDGLAPPELAADFGFSGFRLRNAINRPEVMDEFLVFQGASYFRGVGRNQVYGSSARGLAIRTADPRGEEFPAFTEFWLERPEPNSTHLRFLGLLESDSVVGAYSFIARPGDETLMEIEATLYPRADVAAFGIAPLTSMFLFDSSNRFAFDDFRAAVCDANGLQMITGSGQRLWRPLSNAGELQVSSFLDSNPTGFGLTQRRREFMDYGDVEARYDRRPSAWVEPVGEWGEGSVVLVEIPMENEFNDNIVAYWRPLEPLRKGEPRTWSYRLRWCGRPPDDVPLARVHATRTGIAPNTGRRLFVIDFAPADGEPEGPLEVAASCSAGKLVQTRLEKLPVNGLRRVTLEFEPGDAKVSELNVSLRQAELPASETWLYRWTRP